MSHTSLPTLKPSSPLLYMALLLLLTGRGA